MGLPHKNSPAKEKPLLLFAPLDWGLGHTTRSIPLIRELQKTGLEVVVACNSTQKKIFAEEIPQLRILPLEGYGIRYGKSGWATRLHLFCQTRKILTKIKSENRWLSRFLTENSVAAVISDNRYGLYSRTVPSILITHQLSLRTGFGGLADRWVRKKLYRLIEKFDTCWIPDVESEKESIAGALSHPSTQPNLPLRYLGCLSRFTPCPAQTILTDTVNDGGPLLILLSGPEPQRSIFENILCQQLRSSHPPTIIIRGLPAQEEAAASSVEPQRSDLQQDTPKNNKLTAANIGEHTKRAVPEHTNESSVLPPLPPHCKVLEYASARELNQLICAASLVICRPGYTTLMDMMQLRKKTVMVPTPGQAEQAYLAKRAHHHQLTLAMPQQRFSVTHALQHAARFEYSFPTQLDMTAYREVVQDFAESLTS